MLCCIKVWWEQRLFTFLYGGKKSFFVYCNHNNTEISGHLCQNKTETKTQQPTKLQLPLTTKQAKVSIYAIHLTTCYMKKKTLPLTPLIKLNSVFLSNSLNSDLQNTPSLNCACNFEMMKIHFHCNFNAQSRVNLHSIFSYCVYYYAPKYQGKFFILENLPCNNSDSNVKTKNFSSTGCQNLQQLIGVLYMVLYGFMGKTHLLIQCLDTNVS